MLIHYDVESGLQVSCLTAIPSFGPFGIYRHNLKVLINQRGRTMINFFAQQLCKIPKHATKYKYWRTKISFGIRKGCTSRFRDKLAVSKAIPILRNPLGSLFSSDNSKGAWSCVIFSNEGFVITCYKMRIGKPNTRRKKHSPFKRINRLSCLNAYK